MTLRLVSPPIDAKETIPIFSPLAREIYVFVLDGKVQRLQSQQASYEERGCIHTEVATSLNL